MRGDDHQRPRARSQLPPPASWPVFVCRKFNRPAACCRLLGPLSRRAGFRYRLPPERLEISNKPGTRWALGCLRKANGIRPRRGLEALGRWRPEGKYLESRCVADLRLCYFRVATYPTSGAWLARDIVPNVFDSVQVVRHWRCPLLASGIITPRPEIARRAECRSSSPSTKGLDTQHVFHQELCRPEDRCDSMAFRRQHRIVICSLSSGRNTPL